MLLRISDVTKTFAGTDKPVQVLRGVSFTLERGASLALTGESGSGKSTLLHLIAGLDGFDAGEIEVNGAELSDADDKARAILRRETVGIVFQQFNLVPSLTIAANVRLAARLANREDADWTAYLIDTLGLRDHVDFYPEQLSGGQQQRVAIGRALAPRPPLLLADEPTGNLDEETADDVTGLLMRLVAEFGAGLLTVTHSERLAAQMDRRIHLRAGRVSA